MPTLRALGIAAATLLAAFHAQEPPLTRQVDLTLSEGTAMAAAVSPDGRSIAIDLLGALWIVPVRGGEAKKITPDLLEARLPAWAPDNQTIAFQGYGSDSAWHIYAVSRDGGEPRALTTGEFDDREPAWSHDGTRIAFSSDRYGGISTIWLLLVSTGEARQLSGRDGVMPTWAPNDREVTFVSRDREDTNPRPGAPRRGAPTSGLWAIDLAQGREHLVWANARATAAGWNPDGTLVAFTSSDGRLSLAAAGMADAAISLVVNARTLSGNENVFPFRPQWISGTEIIYTADGHIRRRSINGVAATIAFTATVPLQRTTYTIAHRPLETTDAQPVAGVVRPVVSPNGRAVAFTALGDLWMMPLGGDPGRLTNDPFVELDPAWSPDGRRLAYSSDRDGQMNVYVRDFSTNTEKQVTSGVRVAATNASWAPDGDGLAFVVDGRSLGIASYSGAARRVAVTSAAGGDRLGRPTWASDGRTVAIGSLFPYSDRHREGLNQLLLHALDPIGLFSTAPFPGHSAGNRDGNGPVWSPDGFRLAFVTEGRLWSVPVDEKGGAIGPPTAVTDDQPEAPSWEGDSQHIVYQSARSLRRVLADGGPPEPIAIEMLWKPAPPPERVVVHAGRVFDGVFNGLLGETDIIIERGVVRALAGHSDENHVGNVVDASTEVIIPGLTDMRVRLDRDYGQNFGRVLLAYGITSVRIPDVNPHEGLEQRESFDAGRRAGPRVFLAGDRLDGLRVIDAGGAAVSSVPQLARELERANALGTDLFTTGDRLPVLFQKQVVEFAHAVGKPVTSSSVYPAIAFGIDGVEHLRGRRVYADVIDLLAQSGVVLTPTLAEAGAFDVRARGDKSIPADPRLALFPRRVPALLERLVNMAPDPMLEIPLMDIGNLLKRIVTGGGRVVAGSDSPIVPYGLGLHVELESFVRAGMTPFQALQTATINAAQALGADGELGTIEPGKLADLTFLGGDPLMEIRNTRDVRRVMKGGRLYTVADLLPR